MLRHYSKIISVGNRLKNISINNKMKKLFDFYEDFIGIKEVRKTQEAVLESESKFVESTQSRRNVQNCLIGLQQELKQIRHKLDSTQRSDELFLPLITKEHQLIKEELQVIDSLRRCEERERHLFSEFSKKLRDAHEVERLRQERSKYLSLMFSIVGACLAIIATSINHALKRKDFIQLKQMIEENNIKRFGNHLNGHNFQTNVKSTESETNIMTNEDKIVEYISNTESNLEYKMKVNSLTTVVAIYGLIAITLPFIIRFISD